MSISLPHSLVIVIVGYTIMGLVSLSGGSHVFPSTVFFNAFLLFVLVCLPLQVIGTLVGRAFCGNPDNPCRTASIPSSIPPSPFYSNPVVITCISGILPFGCIFIEVFFVFASLWSYRYYFMYGFLIAIISILCFIPLDYSYSYSIDCSDLCVHCWNLLVVEFGKLSLVVDIAS